jgi:hypothetical protein
MQLELLCRTYIYHYWGITIIMNMCLLVLQAAHLLQAPKSSPDYITDITSTCFKLNSLQLRELLQRYIPEPGEPPVPHSLIEGVTKIAENMADELIKNDGRQVCLEEDGDLQLPFLLPEDGYTCDSIKGIPKGMEEFVEPLAKAGRCITRVGGEWEYLHEAFKEEKGLVIVGYKSYFIC